MLRNRRDGRHIRTSWRHNGADQRQSTGKEPHSRSIRALSVRKRGGSWPKFEVKVQPNSSRLQDQQERGVALSKKHHEPHHQRPYNDCDHVFKRAMPIAWWHKIRKTAFHCFRLGWRPLAYCSLAPVGGCSFSCFAGGMLLGISQSLEPPFDFSQWGSVHSHQTDDRRRHPSLAGFFQGPSLFLRLFKDDERCSVALAAATDFVRSSPERTTTK